MGMYLTHYIPQRISREGQELGDSKGAAAALAVEVAIDCVQKVLMGFKGAKDIFRNYNSVFRIYSKESYHISSFDLILGFRGDSFAILDSFFKIGIYQQ